MKISVVTTTYNRKEYLRQTILSVQKSIVTPLDDIEWEHVIYDDGSTDGTQHLFSENVWKNIVYIKSEENLG